MTTATGIATGRVPTPHGKNRSETLGDAISVPRRVGLTATLDSNVYALAVALSPFAPTHAQPLVESIGRVLRGPAGKRDAIPTVVGRVLRGSAGKRDAISTIAIEQSTLREAIGQSVKRTPTGARQPTGVAVDGAGNAYVADRDSSTIRKVTAEGVVTTLAGTAGTIGSTDGTGAAARFNNPIGVAVDGAGNVYVADQGNSTIRRVTPTGITTTVAGTAGMAGILLGATPRLASPRSLAIVGDSIVVSDANAVLLLRHGAR